ncbi:hypothetical protein Efla_001684 [Eimeria flavescens]
MQAVSRPHEASSSEGIQVIASFGGPQEGRSRCLLAIKRTLLLPACSQPVEGGRVATPIETQVTCLAGEERQRRGWFSRRSTDKHCNGLLRRSCFFHLHAVCCCSGGARGLERAGRKQLGGPPPPAALTPPQRRWALNALVVCLVFCLLACIVASWPHSAAVRSWAAAACGCSCCLVEGPRGAPLPADKGAPEGISKGGGCRPQHLLCDFLCCSLLPQSESDERDVQLDYAAADLQEEDSSVGDRRFLAAWGSAGGASPREYLGGPQTAGAPPRRLSEPVLASLEEPRTLASLSLIALASFVAVATGTGGGVFYVPILSLLVRYPIHRATAASMACICGNTFALTFFNFWRRHPAGDRPLIDLNAVLFLAPAQMAGVGFGVVTGHCLPAWGVALLLTSLLAAMTLKAGKHHEALSSHMRGCCRPRRCCFRCIRRKQQTPEAGPATGRDEDRHPRFVWASRMLSHLVPPLPREPQPASSSQEEAASAPPSLSSVSCLRDGEKPQQPRQRRQKVAALLDMRLDSGVWLLHPKDGVNETRWPRPAADFCTPPYPFSPSSSSRWEAGSCLYTPEGEAPQPESAAESGGGPVAARLCTPAEGPGPPDVFLPVAGRSSRDRVLPLRPASQEGNGLQQMPALRGQAAAAAERSGPGASPFLLAARRLMGAPSASGAPAAMPADEAPTCVKRSSLRKVASAPLSPGAAAREVELRQRRLQQRGRRWRLWRCAGHSEREDAKPRRPEKKTEEQQAEKKTDGEQQAQAVATLPTDSSRQPAGGGLPPHPPPSPSSCSPGFQADRRSDSEDHRAGAEASLARMQGGHGGVAVADQPHEEKLKETGEIGETQIAAGGCLLPSEPSRASFLPAREGQRETGRRRSSSEEARLAVEAYCEPATTAGGSLAEASGVTGRDPSLGCLPAESNAECCMQQPPGFSSSQASEPGEKPADRPTAADRRRGGQHSASCMPRGGRSASGSRMRGKAEEEGGPHEEQQPREETPGPRPQPSTRAAWGVGLQSCFPSGSAAHTPELLSPRGVGLHHQTEESSASSAGLAGEEEAEEGEGEEEEEEQEEEGEEQEGKGREGGLRRAEAICCPPEASKLGSRKPRGGRRLTRLNTLRLVVLARRVDDPLRLPLRSSQSFLLRSRTALSALERRHSVGKWLLVTTVWAVYVGLGVIRGSQRSPTQLVAFCGAGYWLVFCLSNAFALLFAYGRGLVLWALQKEKDAAELQPLPGDIHFDLQTVNTFLLQTVLSGAIGLSPFFNCRDLPVSGCTVGVGGGMFLGPLMLLNGMLPAVAQATNGAAIMFSSSSGVLYSVYSQTIPADLAAVLFGLACLSGLAGKVLVNCIVS